MLMQTHQTFPAVFLILSLIWTFGCETNNSVESDTEPPAIPRGVVSITGNERVTVEWFPNGEQDLAGYKVWRSSDDSEYDLLANLSADAFRYVDDDVRNGRSYFYAVSAYDYDGNESELSLEQVYDTPRPSGNSVTLDDFALFPARSGFDFSRPERGAIPWDSRAADVYFEWDTLVNVAYLYSDNLTKMQDMGYHKKFSEVDVSPQAGFTGEFVELIEGHIYVFYTPDGNYAKIRTTAVSDSYVTFDWAYQIDPNNPELAPPAPRN